MGFPSYSQNSNGTVWEVDFLIKTYKENTKIVFYANIDTHTVYPGDSTAKNVLDIVNTSTGSNATNTLYSTTLT